MRYIFPILVFVLILAIGAGCLGIGTGEQDRDSVSEDGFLNQFSKGMAPVPTPVPTLAPSGPVSTGDGIIDQKLIKTGYISLEVQKVLETVDVLRELAVRHQGYLSSSSVAGDTANRLSGTVVLRVPADQFDATVTEIKSLGTLRSASVNSQDVTEEFVDLQARKGALQLQLEQFNRIMEKADKVEDILKIQVEIGRVQEELDRLEGRLRYLNNRIDLSTITVSLQEPPPLGGDTGHDFISVINTGIQGLLATIDGIIIGFFMFLPLIILAVVIYAIYRWRKGKRGVPPVSHPAPAPEKI